MTFAISEARARGFAGVDNELYFQRQHLHAFRRRQAVVGHLVKQFAGDGMH